MDLVIDGGRSRYRAARDLPLGTALDGGRLLADSSLPAPFDALVHQTGGQDP